MTESNRWDQRLKEKLGLAVFYWVTLLACVCVCLRLFYCVCACVFFFAFILKHYSIHPRTRNVSILYCIGTAQFCSFGIIIPFVSIFAFSLSFFFFIDFSSLILFHFNIFWFNAFCFDIRAVLHFFGETHTAQTLSLVGFLISRYHWVKSQFIKTPGHQYRFRLVK